MSKAGSREDGFTLVESLVAIVVLVFGLIAVTNLLLVAASSNTVANQGTGATASASERMEILRNMQFNTLLGAVGGSLTANVGPTNPCSPPGPGVIPLPPATYNCTDDIPGIGRIVTRWQITAVPGTGRMVFIQVRSEGTGALSQRRSRAEFTTLRSCTDATPVTTVGVVACPDVP
jgi:prepilin-type N-terminal cleavage/methylation domain-containing protein